MAITVDHTFGWEKEKELKSQLESHLNLPLTQTEDRYDHRDYVCPSKPVFVELKSRKAFDKHGRPQMPIYFSTWLIPVAKESILKKGDELHIYYYWDYDKSLYHLKYSKETFQNFKKSVPAFHTQPHYWIPSSAFAKISGKTKCLIVDGE